MPDKHKYKHAFTLVEVLLAMTITSIIILAVHGAYNQGNMVWLRSEYDAQFYHHINTVAEMLRSEISSVYIPTNENAQQDSSKEGGDEEKEEGDGKKEEGDGKKEEDFFVLSSSGLSFYTLNPSNSTSPRYAKISKVSYTCKGNKLTRTGLLAAGAKTIEAPSIDDGKAGTNTSFDVPNVRFEACVIDKETKKYVWKTDFKSKDSLPKAIAVYFEKAKSIHTQSFEAKLIIKCF